MGLVSTTTPAALLPANDVRPCRLPVAEASKLLRAALKAELGLTSREVSVRSESFSMGSAINVEVKAAIGLGKVAAIVKRFEDAGPDKGGNRYVHIDHSTEATATMREACEIALLAAREQNANASFGPGMSACADGRDYFQIFDNGEVSWHYGVEHTARILVERYLDKRDAAAVEVAS